MMGAKNFWRIIRQQIIQAGHVPELDLFRRYAAGNYRMLAIKIK